MKNGVVIDTCAECQGAWLDRGELGRFTRNRAVAQDGADNLSWDSTHSERDCCNCGEKMLVGEFSDSGIQLDYCRHCEGLWFDAKELKKTLRFLQTSLPESEEPRDDRQPSHVPRDKRLSLIQKLADSLAAANSEAYRAVRDTPVIDPSEGCQGYIAARGRVSLGKDALTSPVSRTRCAAYHSVQIQKRRKWHMVKKRDVNTHDGWSTDYESHIATSVASDDWHYSTCIVDCGLVRIQVPLRNALMDVTPREQRSVGRATGTERLSSNQNVERVYLQDGESVFVYGTVQKTGIGFRLTATNEGPLIVTENSPQSYLEDYRSQLIRSIVKKLVMTTIIGAPIVAAIAFWWLTGD